MSVNISGSRSLVGRVPESTALGDLRAIPSAAVFFCRVKVAVRFPLTEFPPLRILEMNFRQAGFPPDGTPAILIRQS